SWCQPFSLRPKLDEYSALVYFFRHSLILQDLTNSDSSDVDMQLHCNMIRRRTRPVGRQPSRTFPAGCGACEEGLRRTL
ncbi:MAG TPA: hypothetical protein VJM82_03295, partial [Nitrospiraceae bacterium]|nr:hypothetical protein [Nitrospiraceae bacterium]